MHESGSAEAQAQDRAEGQAGTGATRGEDEEARMETAVRTPESIEEPATAWRTWALRGGHLHSPQQGTRWEHGTALRARADQVWAEILLFALSTVQFFETVALGPFIFVRELESIRHESRALVVATLAVMALLAFTGTAVALCCWQDLRRARAWRNAPVQPGTDTPGIYGLNDPAMLEEIPVSFGLPLTHPCWRLFEWGPARLFRWLLGWELALVPGVMVRGQVYMWGNTILHEEGVKAGYAYPRSITDVGCVRCFDWLSIDEWDGHGAPRCTRYAALRAAADGTASRGGTDTSPPASTPRAEATGCR